jgi:hypothetical protein
MERLAASGVGRNARVPPAVGPADDLPPEYWQAVLDDAVADAKPPAYLVQKQRLCDIPRHVLRVACRRCERILEIQKADAVRLYGCETLWEAVGQRLLDNTCRHRTGRHEEDGCWPSYE